MSDRVTVGPEILAVDDDAVCLEYLKSVLEDLGYQCSLASGGEEALQMIRQQKPRVLLLDLDMPDMRGEELIKLLKEDDDYRDIRIIVISAEEDSDAVANSINIGADDHIIKPFNPTILNARLQSSMARQWLREMQLNEEKRLTELVEERTQEINRKNGQLRSLDKAKNQFLNSLSHELLTPLNSLGIVDLLMQDEVFTKQERQDLYDSYQNAYGRLKKVVDHALILSEMTVLTERKGDITFHPSDLIAMLTDVASTNDAIDPPAIEDQHEADDFIVGNCKRIFQAFQEVIELAVKFSNQSRNLQITGRLSDGCFVIRLKSWGYEIPQDYLDKFFEVFAIPDALFPGGGDIGLGAAMARQVLLAHDGDISVRNHEESGIEFTATLPVTAIPAAGV